MTPLSERLVADIEQEFPRFRLLRKRDSALCRVIDVAIKVLTLGVQREFMTHYHTVLWDTLYLPESWESTPDVARAITLCHERIHLRQRRRYGDVLLTFLYLVPFFPLGAAYGRARIEWEAYAETLRATAEYRGLPAARAPELREHIVRQFTGGAYGWMWPFRKSVDRWYDAALARLETEPSTFAGVKEPGRPEPPA